MKFSPRATRPFTPFSEAMEQPKPVEPSVPHVSAIVIAKNEEKMIGKCISSLVNQDYPNLDIIVVDSDSSDNTFQVAKSCDVGNRSIRFAKSKGNAAAARNAGLHNQRGPITAFVDGDSHFDKGWLKRAVRNLMENKETKVAGVGGPFVQIPRHKTATSLSICEVEATTLGGAGSIMSHVPDRIRKARSLSLSGAVFSSDAIAKIGPFRENLDYCEDSDFCQRARSLGYTLVSFGDLGAFHTPKYDTIPQFISKMWHYGIGRGKATRTHWKLMTTTGMFSIAYLVVLFSSVLLGMTTGLTAATFAGLLLAGVYLVAILASSLLIAKKNASLSVLVASFVGYLALHIPYTVGLIVGILGPEKKRG